MLHDKEQVKLLVLTIIYFSMKTTLFTVALLFASNFCNSQRIFEPTNGSWDNPNLSVETFDNFVVSGYTEINPGTGLLTPTFKISTTTGAPVTSYYVEYSDDIYLMDFDIREANHSIILTGMTALTGGGTPHKMIVAEVDFFSGSPIQSSLEYPFTINSMVPHQVIHSEISGQVTIVGTQILGPITPSNFAFVPKTGFVLGLDINDFNNIIYSPIEMDLPPTSGSDYDMLENITEVDGFGYFISGSCNGPSGTQNVLTMGIDYGGSIAFSHIIDNTNSRFAGSSVMYNQALDVVYLMVNNSILHQLQIGQFDPYSGNFVGSAGGWVSHQFTAFPIGGGVDQNGFRLQQTPDNLIIAGGYLSAPFGALGQQLTPFQIVMKEDLIGYIAGKLYQSDNNAPLSPSYFEENGNSVFINTPDMIAYNEIENRTYLVNQNSNYGGFDLNVSSLINSSNCEKRLKANTFVIPPNFVGVGNFNPLPMYPSPYFPNPVNKPISESILCAGVSPTAIAVTSSNPVLAPNPASDLLSITLEEETIQDVSVYDMKGNLVLSQKATERTPKEMTLSVGKLDQGTYVIEITTKEGNVRHERFVKQ